MNSALLANNAMLYLLGQQIGMDMLAICSVIFDDAA
jgi:hypothetical protein